VQPSGETEAPLIFVEVSSIQLVIDVILFAAKIENPLLHDRHGKR
jgi:hypothetical protein